MKKKKKKKSIYLRILDTTARLDIDMILRGFAVWLKWFKQNLRLSSSLEFVWFRLFPL